MVVVVIIIVVAQLFCSFHVDTPVGFDVICSPGLFVKAHNLNVSDQGKKEATVLLSLLVDLMAY